MRIIRSLKKLALLAILVVPILVACEKTKSPPVHTESGPLTTGKLISEIQNQREIGAPVQRAAFDPQRSTIFLATLVDLYAVRNDKVSPIAKSPAPDAQLLLAPGGGLYAWLIPDKKSRGLYLVQLMDIDGKHLAELSLQEPPHGFGALVLGFQGKIIVTVTALDDWQGAHGRFQFTFWSLEGKMLNKVILPERAIPVAGTDGESLLLLGQKEAGAYSTEGKLLWRLEGRFRKGAIGRAGEVALFNPASRKEIDRVYVFTGSGKPTVITMPTPVHHLRVSPDGSSAVVCGDHGRYFYLEPNSSQLEEGVRLPFEAELFISDIELVDRDTIAVGVLQRKGDPPRHTWPSGGLVVITRKGDVLFRTEYPIREPLASRPGVDVTFENPIIICFTLDTTSLVRLGHEQQGGMP